MTTLTPDRLVDRNTSSQVEAPHPPIAALAVPGRNLLADQLLDDGEQILLALKPSLWFVPFASWRWLFFAAALGLVSAWPPLAEYRWILFNSACWLAAGRLVVGLAQWVSRFYVLTDRRIMRIRGCVTVEVFECPLTRIQNTDLVLSPAERITRTGSIVIYTAGYGGGQVTWRTVARPLEVHERLRAAIRRARHRGDLLD